MDRSDGIARRQAVGAAGAAGERITLGGHTAHAHAASAAVALLVLGTVLALLVVGLPSREGWPHGRPVADATVPLAPLPATGMLVGRDSIDGHPVLNPAFIERMKQVAARIPPAVLAGQARDPRVRYLAQAFTPGDDPGLAEGWFEDSAAALAFGCAMEDAASPACGLTSVDPALEQMSSGPASMSTSSYRGVSAGEFAPGWRCRPLGVAMGSPVFEPDRCEPAG